MQLVQCFSTTRHDIQERRFDFQRGEGVCDAPSLQARHEI